MVTNSRQEKLDNLTGERYPRDFPGRETIASILNPEPRFVYPNTKEILINDELIIRKIAGRVLARRNHGEIYFFDLVDQTGTIQLIFKIKDCMNDELIDKIIDCDLGDCIGVEGTLSENPRGEVLFQIINWTLLAKALKEPGDKFHGVKDPEMKYRHRELDLLSSADSRAVFQKRAEIIFEIRKYLNEKDFIEIECPVLQPIYGGATAKPFKTKHNALGQDFFLSISSELYLKRAMVGGFDRVYSFSRCFRNEGISPEHNPEFTNLEIFESCKTSDDMESFTTKLIHYLQEKFTPDYAALKFMRSMPVDAWPLSRKIGDESNEYADAWELYINDMEIASGATDLNDPREQDSRLKRVSAIYLSSDDDGYNPYDKNYIEALEYGALPWAGVGIGIDRLIMLLLGITNIRDSILFPTLKSQPQR